MQISLWIHTMRDEHLKYIQKHFLIFFLDILLHKLLESSTMSLKCYFFAQQLMFFWGRIWELLCLWEIKKNPLKEFAAPKVFFIHDFKIIDSHVWLFSTATKSTVTDAQLFCSKYTVIPKNTSAPRDWEEPVFTVGLELTGVPQREAGIVLRL